MEIMTILMSCEWHHQSLGRLPWFRPIRGVGLIRASLIGHCLVGRESQFRSCCKLMGKGQMKQIKSCGFNGHDFMILKVKTYSERQFEKLTFTKRTEWIGMKKQVRKMNFTRRRRKGTTKSEKKMEKKDYLFSWVLICAKRLHVVKILFMQFNSN